MAFPVKDRISQLREELRAAADAFSSPDDVEQFRITYLARKGKIADVFDALKSAPASDKPELGRLLNELRREAEALLEQARAAVTSGGPRRGVPRIDPTLPGRKPLLGHKHIVSQTLDEIRRIFDGMGFSVATGPELESDYYNFGALNFPHDHPARDMQDTFFVNPGILLRTHTSPVQIRVMEKMQPPVRVIMPGRVYRNEVISARSHVQFHQVEGLYVDKGVTFADLKGTLVSFVKQFYGSSLSFRFRPSFFPFTEPSAEMDITCYLCGGGGCRVCKHSGWLEILGCGMVDPNVFASVGYDPDVYTGYAFGIGIERTAMLRYGIDDIRLLFENDLRVNRQFNES